MQLRAPPYHCKKGRDLPTLIPPPSQCVLGAQGAPLRVIEQKKGPAHPDTEPLSMSCDAPVCRPPACAGEYAMLNFKPCRGRKQDRGLCDAVVYNAQGKEVGGVGMPPTGAPCSLGTCLAAHEARSCINVCGCKASVC